MLKSTVEYNNNFEEREEAKIEEPEHIRGRRTFRKDECSH